VKNKFSYSADGKMAVYQFGHCFQNTGCNSKAVYLIMYFYSKYLADRVCFWFSITKVLLFITSVFY